MCNDCCDTTMFLHSLRSPGCLYGPEKEIIIGSLLSLYLLHKPPWGFHMDRIIHIERAWVKLNTDTASQPK